jgi:CSLREA domain-containing protein
MAALLFSQAQAATITVNSDADAGGTCPGATCTLRHAITTATEGDTITFSLPANSTINLTSGQLIISKNLTINGPGANLSGISGKAPYPLLAGLAGTKEFVWIKKRVCL